MVALAPEATALLEIRDLVTEFRTDQGTVRAVDGISFEIAPRATLGVVGESGCGKSVTALSIMRLIASPPGRIAGGTIKYAGRDLLALRPAEMRAIRGNRIAMIFQEPMTSLNPVFTVGDQVGEAVRIHQHRSRSEARGVAIEMFRRVGIPSPEDRIDAYPHQLSGGMRQRVMIAMALACKPDLLIADEPTTALDVTIQAQILDLLRALQRDLGMSILLITHDLGVVAETCDDVIVMYAGRIVERARTDVLFAAPRHHYTAGLLRSVPSYGDGSEVTRRTRLLEIQGIVPSLHELPRGCKFVDRCPAAEPLCHAEEPPLVALGASWVRCHYPIDPPSASPRTRALDPPDPRDPRDPPGRPPGTPPKDPPIDPGAPPGDPPIDPPRAPPEAPLIDPPRSPPSRPPGDPPIDPPIEPPKDPSIDPPLDAPGAPGGPPRKDAT